MKRISKELKAIADAHMKAKNDGIWNPKKATSAREMVQAMREGHTYKDLLENIEIRHCSVTSLIAGAVLGAEMDSYRKGVYTGFRKELGDLFNVTPSK